MKTQKPIGQMSLRDLKAAHFEAEREHKRLHSEIDMNIGNPNNQLLLKALKTQRCGFKTKIEKLKNQIDFVLARAQKQSAASKSRAVEPFIKKVGTKYVHAGGDTARPRKLVA